jgi:hypothetical protein
VLEQLPHGDAPSVVALAADYPGQQFFDGRLEGETAFADEPQDSRSDEGLGEAPMRNLAFQGTGVLLVTLP